jgi:ribosome-binding protein aMBF1 (putative translation factor)
MPQDFAATIRAAIAKSGKSQYALREETGISQGRIGAFINGGSMRLEHASKLAHAVGLELRPKSTRAKRGARQGG